MICSKINNTTIKGTSAVMYDGTPLPCTNITTCTNLNTILSEFDNILLNITEDTNILSEDINILTEEVILISENIININSQLNICCPPTTSTTTTISFLCNQFLLTSLNPINVTFTYKDCNGLFQDLTLNNDSQVICAALVALPDNPAEDWSITLTGVICTPV